MAQNKSNPKQDQAKDKSAPAMRSFMKNDFPLIRKALITLIASLLLSAVLVSAGRAIRLKQQDSLVQAQAQRNDASTGLHQAENDKQEIHDYQPAFMALRERGFVGEERRLDWIEHIKYIQENRKLLPITYEISAQQVFQIDPEEFQINDLELRGSKMIFQMGLLHEGDLLNFLDDLKRNGFYAAQECKIKRAGTELESAHLPLAAECMIYWLTLGDRVDSPEQTPQ